MSRAGQYFQLAAPDRMKLAELLLKAKGPSRTMADFAQLTGISTSTLSRIANGKITKPLNHELLQTVYNCRDGEANFSFSALLLANGTVEKDAYEKGKAMTQRLLAHEESIIHERQAKNAIVNALLARGITVQSIPRSFEHRKYESPFGISAPYDFNFYIEDAPERLWYFEVVDKPGGIPTGMGRTFIKTSRIFLLDAWQPDFLKGQKNSFIFFYRETYAQFVANYQGAPIQSSVSAILVNPKTEEVIEESWISEQAKIGSVFDRPFSEDEGFVGTWLDGEDDEDEYWDEDND